MVGLMQWTNVRVQIKSHSCLYCFKLFPGMAYNEPIMISLLITATYPRAGEADKQEDRQ